MLFKVLFVLLLLVIVYTLISSFFFMVRDKGEGTRTVRRLTWRVGLSLLLFALLYIAFLAGWVQPGSGNPVHYPRAEQTSPDPGE
jgi:cytochrome bd-type quinol oxidase subunit 2